MLTLKFDFTEQSSPEQGVIQFYQGRNLRYEHREVKSKEEYEKIDNGKLHLGRSVHETLSDPEVPQAHFILLNWWSDKGEYYEAILHGGTCYVMNEQAKTVEIIS